MEIHVAIDFGTTNSVVAQWNDEIDGPTIMHLDGICRNTSAQKDIDDSYTIPSCVYLQSPKEALSFPFSWIFKNFKSKTRGIIGRPAIEKDGGTFKQNYVTSFKSHLGKNSYQFIGKLQKWNYTAEEITRIFFKALLHEIRLYSKKRPDVLTICVPVDFYEFYRAHLVKITSKLKVKKVKFIDEPVAAALGYGLTIDEIKHILVIDFGGGTFDVALIRTGENSETLGEATVLVKDGAPIGGNLVDAWIVKDICDHYGYDYDKFKSDPSIQWWYRMLLKEACRVKESLFINKKETFYLLPSKFMRDFLMRIPIDKRKIKKPLDITKDKLISILNDNHLYTMISSIIESVLQKASQKGITEKMIDDVLMVGGSTLLPQIYHHIEERFGRSRVRAWQPFNAVAFGAAAFAAGKIHKSDHITHDYAFITYNKKTHEPEYNIIIPGGTHFPTKQGFWKRQLIPTCALGEPERIFKLVVCEIGKKHSIDQEFIWDAKGEMHILDDESSDRFIVPLNESDPTLGYLDPPHYPSEKRARIEISFMVNEEKWLCATVYDIKKQSYLLQDKPVVKLK